MSIRLSISLVAVLLLGAVFLIWFALSDSPTGPSAPGLSAPAAPGDGVAAPSAGELAPPPAAPEAAEAPDSRREAVPATESDPGEFAIPGDAIWIEGRVVFPTGTPIDEQLTVEASGKRFTKDRKAPRKHSAPVGPDGRFRIALGKGTRRGFLSVKGRYLYLDGKQKVAPAEQVGEVVLEPMLGGVVAGTIAPPAGIAISEEEYGKMVVSARDYRSRHGVVQRFANPAGDGSFEIRGVPPGPDFDVGVDSKSFADSERKGVAVVPGEITEVSFLLTRGVRLAGRVVGGDGEGLGGVQLSVDIEAGNSSNHMRNITGKDGSFDLAGMMPGTFTLHVEAAGCAKLIEELGELEEGAVREDLIFQPSSGLEIAGRVVWPDGIPAVGASVRVVQKSEEDEYDFQARELGAKTDDDGRFRVTGLREEPVTVTASGRRVLPAEGTKKRRPRRGPLWKGKLNDVLPGTEGLVVVLSPGETLRGRVIDGGGAPVTSYEVMAIPVASEMDQGLDWRNQVSRNSRNENGEFELPGLASGTWHVDVSGKGLISPERREVVIPDETFVELRVTRAARLAGTVTDPSGVPVGGAEIDLTERSDRRSSTSHGLDTTDGEGRFELLDVPVGSVTLCAKAPGWGQSEGLELEVVAGEEREGLLLVLRRGARLTGEVHPAAEPIGGREINVHGRKELSYWGETHSDASGRFVLEGLPPGEFNVRLKPPSSRPDEGNWRLRDAQRDEVTVTLTEGGTIHVVLGEPPANAIGVSGKVTVGGKPVPGIVVQCGRESFRTAAACDDGGNYSLEVDGPGTYWFSLSSREGQGSASFHREIAKGAGERQDFDLPSASISGQLIDASGNPVKSTTVSVELVEASDGGATQELRSGDQGEFHFSFLRPGRYLLRAGGPSWYDGDARYAVSLVDDLVLETGGELKNLVVELRPGGTITGQVTRPDGTPFPHAWLQVRDERGRNIATHGIGISDEKGNFSFQGIPAGTVTVFVNTSSGESPAVTVRVSVGATSRVDLVVPE